MDIFLPILVVVLVVFAFLLGVTLTALAFASKQADTHMEEIRCNKWKL